jgi:two-component system, response regulator
MSHAVEILLVEDSPEDAELTIRALRRNKIANEIQVAEDGAELWIFFFAAARLKIGRLLRFRGSSCSI